MASKKATDKRLEAQRIAIAARVKQCLELRGLKIIEFCKLNDIKPSFMTRVINAETNLTLQSITKLEVALDYPLISVSSENKRLSGSFSGGGSSVMVPANE